MGIVTQMIKKTNAKIIDWSNVALLIRGWDGISVDASGNMSPSFSQYSIWSGPGKWGSNVINLDSAGEYIYTNATSPTLPGSNGLTMEMWVYRIAAHGNGNVAVGIGNYLIGALANYWSFGITSTGAVQYYTWTTVATRITSTALIPLNTWAHIACVINGTAITLFLDGQIVATGTYKSPGTSGKNYPSTIGAYYGKGMRAYVNDLRVSTCVRYSGPFDLPTGPLNI